MTEARSYSQYGQDRFVAEAIYRGKRGGYFVEAGAGAGIWISNTLLLERQYGWTGILIESTSAFAALQRNRPDCICDNSGLASEEGLMTMVEISIAVRPPSQPLPRTTFFFPARQKIHAKSISIE